ncbi:MAG: CotH kinase family protein [Planctomycetes bacterium]|nr:CotH kinase family protein [Planctomycetota bacterium]
MQRRVQRIGSIAGALSVIAVLSPVEGAEVPVPFRRADANASGAVDIADPIFTLAHVFRGEAGPPCLAAADANGDGSVDISDPIFTLLYLFQGTRAPPPPGPLECGLDPTADGLGCASYAPCASAENQSPVASFSAHPTSGSAPLQVALDASASSDPDGTISAYAWDFGDGASGTGRVAIHTYLEPGEYALTLTVRDDDGSAAMSARTITVLEDPGPGGDFDALATAPGCPGVYNPNQVLDYHLELAQGDWSALLADGTNAVYFEAELRCEGEEPITVGVRRKRSGGTDKVGLKIDTNRFVEGQEYHGLHKLSLENGISEGDSEASIRDLLAEQISWRIMTLSGAHAGRAALVRLHVNGELLGVYVNVEQVDKVFLRKRLGDDTGWLFKKSGGDDGWRTREGEEDPYEAFFCFWEQGARSCAVPGAGELQDSLPERLHIDRLLRMGGVNMLIGNADGPLAKDNNYYFYDRDGGPRVYLPWDLDTVMKERPDVFSIAAKYAEVLFVHWEDDYDRVLTELVEGPLSLEAIHAEIDRALRVAGSALDGDPHLEGDRAAAASSELKSWWTARHAEVVGQVAAH